MMAHVEYKDGQMERVDLLRIKDIESLQFAITIIRQHLEETVLAKREAKIELWRTPVDEVQGADKRNY